MVGERLSVRQAREVRQVGGLRLGQPIVSRSHLYGANRERFDFRPFTSDEWDHRAVGTQILHRWPIWSQWSLALQTLQVGRLISDIGRAGGLGVPPHRRFLQRDVPEEG